MESIFNTGCKKVISVCNRVQRTRAVRAVKLDFLLPWIMQEMETGHRHNIEIGPPNIVSKTICG